MTYPLNVNEPIALQCPHCLKVSRQKVIDCRGQVGGEKIRRRRECGCGKRFTTFEYVSPN